MPLQYFMEKLHLDEAELQSRRAFFEITADDLKRLSSLRAFAEKHTDEIVEDLYELILGHPEAKRQFTEHATLVRVKRAQRDYFVGLFAGRCDLAYAQDRLRIGIAHERVGVPPKWYLGAYARYLRSIFDRLVTELPDPAQARATYQSIEKLVAFDMALAMDTYMAAQVDALARHQAAIRELSTPVIRLYSRVLLLPLIGTIDTHRADQLMEAVLVKIVEEQAHVIIIDIAGVPVVDTKVADHLLKTTEAVRLLGAQTILSGISPTIAKTIVNLGMNISAMHTKSRLADALELAFEIVGKRVTPLNKNQAETPRE
ncbi:MAG TPA: protoglobin domain-containing protein [Kofleriaceae bacterium]